MKTFLYIFLLSFLFTSCNSKYQVEDKLYIFLEEEFSKESMDLAKVLDTLEVLYINEGLILSSSGSDYRQYYQTNIDIGILRGLRDKYLKKTNLKVKISYAKFDSCARNNFSREAYENSKFAKISKTIDNEVKKTGQIASSTVAIPHLKFLSNDDFNHPFYRANILLSLQHMYYRKYIGKDKKHMKNIPKKI